MFLLFFVSDTKVLGLLLRLPVSGTWYIIYNNTVGKNYSQEIHSVDYPYVF